MDVPVDRPAVAPAAPKAKASTPSSSTHRSASSHSSSRKKEARKTLHAASSGTSVSMSKKAADGLDGGAAGLSSGDLFARNLSVMSVAHIARGVGFDAVQKSAADALTEILAK
ncbi:hypothetical protein PHPALM_15948, partial [Phytophthora palmivora]